MGLFLTSVLISFAIQSSVMSFVFGALSKCCSLNYELSLGKNYNTENISSHDFTCQLSTISTLSITYTSHLEIGLPLCQKYQLVGAYDRNRKVACMDRIGQLNDVYGLACMDDQHDEQNDNRPFGRDSGKRKKTTVRMNSFDPYNHKNHNQANDDDDAYESDTDAEQDQTNPPKHPQQNSYPVTSIINIRKCCPANRKYDADRQFCWNEFSSDNSHALLDLPKISIRREDLFVNVTFGTPHCRSTAALIDLVIPSQQVSFENDALKLKGTVYSFDEYCVDVVDDLFEYLVVRSCQDHSTKCHYKGHLCVRKCCPAGYEIDIHDCVPSKRSLKLFFHNVTNKDSSAPLIVPVKATPAFIFGDPCSEGKFKLDPNDASDSHVLTVDGSVFMMRTKEDLDRNNYCLDNYKSDEVTRTFRCFPKEDKSSEVDGNLVMSMKPTVTVTCAAISVVFLLITFFIYLVLPSLHNLHGKLIMCYLMTSALSYSTVVVSIMLTYERYDSLPNEICVTMGYIMQFTFLSSFSWLNIISYDIWSTFKAVRSAFLKKSSTFKRFSMFCLYGWGSSLLWTGLTVICQYTSIISETSSLKPDIGRKKCFFSASSKAKLVFFVAPVLTMISFNVIIFIFTVKYCANIRTELKKSNNNYSLKRYSADKNELIINLKLFIVMGLNWSMELISLLVKPQNETFFVISDLMNALGGVFIFCIFILKRNVLIDLKGKLCRKRPKGRTFERATGYTTSTTSSIVMNFMNSRRSVSVNP